MQNFSLLDILSHFKYELRLSESTYAAFQKEDHNVYVFNHNDQIKYIDNFLQQGDKFALFAQLSSYFPNEVNIEKHGYSASFTESVSVEEMRKRIIALKVREEAHPHKVVQKVVFRSPDGEDKIPLFRGGNLVNTLLVDGSPLNSSGGHSLLIKPQDPGILKIYTSTAFIDDYFINSHSDIPFLFIHNPSDARVYPGLESFITSFEAPTIIPSKDFVLDIQAFCHLSSFYDTPYFFSVQDGTHPVLILTSRDKRDLKKFTNGVQRKFLKFAKQLEESVPFFKYAETEFFYFGQSAFIPMPKSVQLQHYLFSIIQEQLKLPIQISGLQSSVLEENILSQFGSKPKPKKTRKRKVNGIEDQLEDRLEDQIEDYNLNSKENGNSNGE